MKVNSNEWIVYVGYCTQFLGPVRTIEQLNLRGVPLNYLTCFYPTKPIQNNNLQLISDLLPSEPTYGIPFSVQNSEHFNIVNLDP